MRVLSLNLHGLGDFILSLPVLERLVRGAGARVTALVWPALEEFAHCVPLLERVVPLPKTEENEPELGWFARELAGSQGFDLVLDFAFQPRAGVIVRECGSGRALGFGIDRERLPWYTDSLENLPGEHRLARNLRLLKRLEVASSLVPRFPFAVPPAAAERVERLLTAAGIDPSCEQQRPIALHPGSGVAQRNWPAENFARLADMLACHSGRPLVLLGGSRAYDGADELDLAARVEQRMRCRPLNLAGALTLPELAALLMRCRLFAGNNSGPAHLAASLAGTDCLLVWAPRNEASWGPVGPGRIELVTAELPCGEHCPLNRCQVMQRCLGSIRPEEAFARYLEAFAGYEAGLPPVLAARRG